MSGIVGGVLEFVASHPFAVLLLTLLVVFVFWSYLFLRKTMAEFRKGMKGS